METLPALRHCFTVVTEREATDAEHRWQWEIRRKVLQWSIAQLEREASTAGTAAELSPGLTPAEKQSLEATHPLLRPVAERSVPAYLPTAAWRAAIDARVRKYIASFKRRR